MSGPIALSVNVDHVATLRQARGAPYPDPVEAAAVAETAGASGITVHLRADRRHIQDDDVRRLRDTVRGKLNLEIAPTAEMLAIGVAIGPDQVTLVPERPDELTTEGGLDVARHGDTVSRAAARLRDAGIDVSVFLDPDARQLEALTALGGAVSGFEINTDAYTRTFASAQTTPAVDTELGAIRRVAAAGPEVGLRVYAGHGLTTGNVGPIAALAEIEELNIGHWLISRAALVGLAAAVDEMLVAMRGAR